MTLQEINKMQALLKESPEKVKQFLDDQLLIKQHNQGLINIEIPISDEERQITKAFPLSENLCLIKFDLKKILPFSAFAGKLTLTHRKTGLRMGAIKIKKVEAIRLSEKLEKIANLNFTSSEECNEINNIETMSNLRNAIFKYSI
jgi:hypothetical protein